MLLPVKRSRRYATFVRQSFERYDACFPVKVNQVFSRGRVGPAKLARNPSSGIEIDFLPFAIL